MFYGVSKYIRQEIVKNMNFEMPKIDLGKDNDMASLLKNSKNSSDGEILTLVKQGVEEEKLKTQSTLKVPDKGLKTYQGSKAFTENTSNFVENEPEKIVEKPPVAKIPTMIPSRTHLREGGRKRYSKVAEITQP